MNTTDPSFTIAQTDEHSSNRKTLTIVGILLFLFTLSPLAASAQSSGIDGKPTVITVTGVRFCYPLLQKWIDDYALVNPQVQVIIESRGTNDPAKYDILVEAFEQDDAIRSQREYLYVARYAVLPVANSRSEFAHTYSAKGLNKNLIKQLYFHDLFADNGKVVEVKEPFTVYTRLQKAGIPITFTRYFGFEHKDIQGKAIAGSDEHLLKAVLRDSTAISYLPLTLAYDHQTGKAIEGLSVLPVDLNGNNRVSDEEKIFSSLAGVIAYIEQASPKELNNIPIGPVHLSVSKNNASPEAIAFLSWVAANGRADVHAFGYLAPVAEDNLQFEHFALKGK